MLQFAWSVVSLSNLSLIFLADLFDVLNAKIFMTVTPPIVDNDQIPHKLPDTKH